MHNISNQNTGGKLREIIERSWGLLFGNDKDD